MGFPIPLLGQKIEIFAPRSHYSTEMGRAQCSVLLSLRLVCAPRRFHSFGCWLGGLLTMASAKSSRPAGTIACPTKGSKGKSSLVLAALVIALGASITFFTAVSYAGTCATLSGFPGVLQKAGMVVAGPCDSKGKGQVCSSAACTTADRKPGKCQNIAVSGPANCVCVERTVSKTLR